MRAPLLGGKGPKSPNNLFPRLRQLSSTQDSLCPEVGYVQFADHTPEGFLEPAGPKDGRPLLQLSEKLVSTPADPRVARRELHNRATQRTDADNGMIGRCAVPRSEEHTSEL